MKIQNKIFEFLHIPNIKYHTALKLGGKAFYHKPKTFLGTEKAFPPGVYYWSKVLCGQKMAGPEFEKIKKYDLPFKLREEQVPIVERMLQARNALVEFTTGGGKTVCMISFQYSTKKSTLIVCHAKDMIQQTYDEFKKFLGEDYPVARYNSDYKEIDFVTVTTFSSFTKHPEKFTNFEVLFIDEADAYFTAKARKNICEHPAIRKFGFTGTVRVPADEFRAKGEPYCLEKFWGLKITGEYSKQKISDIFYYYYAKIYKDKWGISVLPHQDWVLFRKVLDQDVGRKQNQQTFLSKNLQKGDRALVLFDRVSDVENFYKSFYNAYIIHGKIKKAEREQQKKDFLEKGGILFAQYKTSSRGVDYPECNKLFIMFPIKNESTLRQSIGRVIRFIPGKKAYVYDFVDQTLDFQWEKRKKAYLKFYQIEPKPVKT